MRNPAISVALVNDYEVIVRGLAHMLRNYTDLIEIVELDANRQVKNPVDIVLYDTFGDPAGYQEIQALVKNPLVGRVVVFGWIAEGAGTRSSLTFGASGYLSKRLPAAGMVDALQRIHAGNIVVSADPPTAPSGPANPGVPVSLGVPASLGIRGNCDWPGREEGLTEREAEMLALITRGLSNADIARVTRLSPNSIKSYIRSCYRRIGVGNRSNAILWGIRHGFEPDHVHIPDPDVV